jgi:hypothetical protein
LTFVNAALNVTEGANPPGPAERHGRRAERVFPGASGEHAMKRLLLPVAVAVLACLPAAARAQVAGLGQPVTNPLGRPVVSPYLNLLRGGNPAINYYGLVRPLENLEAFEQAALTQPSALGLGDPNRPANVSGYNTRYMSYNQYFGTIRPAPVPRVTAGPAATGGPYRPGGR